MANVDMDIFLSGRGTPAPLTTKSYPAPAAWLAKYDLLGITEFRPTVLNVTGGKADINGETPLSIFNKFSTAMTAPSLTIYVATTGNDSSGTGAVGAPYATPLKAQQVAEASGQPCKIYVAGGTYARGAWPQSIAKTFDIAWVANNGIVTGGCFDLFTAPTLTGTYSYTTTIGSVDSVADLYNTDVDGFPKLLRYVSTTTMVERIPGTWTYSAGAAYVHREDEQPVTTTNTRIYRQNGAPIRYTNHISFYMGVEGTGAWRWEGAGPTYQTGAASTNGRHAIVVDGHTFINCGGQSVANGFGTDNVNGVTIVNNCHTANPTGDAYNGHNSVNATKHFFCVLNSSATQMGRIFERNIVAPNQSNNLFTMHDTFMVGLSAMNWCKDARGGPIRCIGDSSTWSVGDRLHDQGDIANGGIIPATAYICDGGNAKMWIDAPDLSTMPRGSRAYTAGTTCNIFLRNAPETALAKITAGSGTITAFTS